MRPLCLVALLGLVALLCLAAPAQAQFYPQTPFGVAPVPYRTYNYNYVNGQFYNIARYGYVYPGSGYTWGWSVGYSPQSGYGTSYYSGYANPYYSPYQFAPTYQSPSYYQQSAAPATTGYVRTPTYSYPSYYVPTY